MKNYKKREKVFIALDNFNTIDYDIAVLELGEKKPSSMKYEKSSAYGQEGYTVVSEDAYEGFERESKLVIGSKYHYDLFMDEFYEGKEVKIQYSDDNGKYRYGTISGIADNVLFQENREIILTVDLQPFKYQDSAVVEVQAAIELYNQGNIYSLPLVKVFGTGTGKIYIGNYTMEVNVDESMTIDCKEIDVFDKFGLRANSRRLKGDFFRLNPGKNTIRFDGGITKLEIDVKWRWR